MILITEVYCKDCKHLVGCGPIGDNKRCAAGVVEKDYLGTSSYKTACKDKNEDKDCEDYKKKWWFK